MNSTKKITQGAMMIAILGALILIDRMTSFLFTELIVLMIPIAVILYSAMNTFKDSLYVSAGIIIISFILGNFYSTYLIYCPVGILTGIVYSYGLSKNKDRRTLMLSAIVTYVIGELLAYYIIYPLLGFPVASMINEFTAVFDEVKNRGGLDYGATLSQLGVSLDKMLVIIFLGSTILMGAMEGLLIHILSVFLLKRFKIKDIGNINIWEMKPNKVLSYVSMILVFSAYLNNFVHDETLNYVFITLTLLGSVVLLYYGYIFVVLYSRIVLKKNLAFIFILLCVFMPTLVITLILMGFLYGAGPFREYLERKLLESQNENREGY